MGSNRFISLATVKGQGISIPSARGLGEFHWIPLGQIFGCSIFFAEWTGHNDERIWRSPNASLGMRQRVA